MAPSLLSVMTSLYPSVHGVSTFPNPGTMNERVTTSSRRSSRLAATRRAPSPTAGTRSASTASGRVSLTYPLNEGDAPDEHASNLAHPMRLAENLERTLRWIDEFKDEPFFLFFHTYEIHGPYMPPEADIQRWRPEYHEKEEHDVLVAKIDHLLATGEIDADGVRLVLKHKEHCNAGAGEKEMALLYPKLKEYGIRRSDIMGFWRDLAIRN